MVAVKKPELFLFHLRHRMMEIFVGDVVYLYLPSEYSFESFS